MAKAREAVADCTEKTNAGVEARTRFEAYITPTGGLQALGTSPQRFFFMKCMADKGIPVDINR